MSISRRVDKDVVYTYNGILFSYKKKNEIMSFAATWMDLEIVTLHEVKSVQDKCHVTPITSKV